MALRIDRQLRGDFVVFLLSGRIQASELPELRSLTEAEGSPDHVVLDLQQIGLVDREAVHFLVECERQGIKLENTTAYIRQWMETERD